MNKNLILAGVTGIIILGGIIFLASKDKNSSNPAVESSKSSETEQVQESMIFFYGKGCPHCENVEKFLEENKNIEEKVKFSKLEVWGNKNNMNLMVEKAKMCKMDVSNLGVPLFWDGEKCLVGDTPIIEFLKNKANE